MKSREHVVTNGRAVFYACLWEDFRKAALDCGWALGLHGSLSSDMDIMAMPWIEDAKSVNEMISSLEDCLTKPDERILEQQEVQINQIIELYIQFIYFRIFILI
jgi:hypothetical protein